MSFVPDISLLEAAIGHSFRDPALLAHALVHSSAREEAGGRDNQTLEFLGDAVVGLAVSDLATRTHPTLDEGALTRLRASVVNASSLAAVARTLGLGRFLTLGKGEEKSGGRDKERILAACYEAVVGAAFCDGGYGVARTLVERHLGALVAAGNTAHDFKTALQELAQERAGGTPTYRLVDEQGPAHARRFTVEVVLRDRVLARGSGANRKEAEQEAARTAIAIYERAGGADEEGGLP
jgi:ribonuclease-3